MKIAISQMKMSLTEEENLSTILETIEAISQSGAKLCIFPELAITGFNGPVIVKSTHAKTNEYIASIKQACLKHQIGVLVGCVIFKNSEKYNGSYYINEKGDIEGYILKEGLTESEKKAFSQLQHRPTFTIENIKFSAIFCREIEDHETIHFTEEPEIIFWPSYIGEP
ncbi:MAG: nitrilase-related carbon-nitrogen hydrolase [Endozoicomonas sp.]|uniref:nitrilase-related carbon-nitrogen hydrolase n=1 Tax=Endozoicomonas sp. TaxID=1892382 RepID=UPI003D9B674D